MKYLKKISIKLLTTLYIILFIGCSSDEQSNINTAPEIATEAFTVIENTTTIGSVTVKDVDEDTLEFSISQNNNNLFTINNNGELQVATGKNLDFETQRSHLITVQVNDGEESVQGNITITVTDDLTEAIFIPDANFKQALLNKTNINTNNDNEIQQSEAEAITGLLNIQSKNIRDFTGIEAFINITELDISGNTANRLDLSKNKLLTKIYGLELYGLTSLDVTQNILLTNLSLETALTNIDLSQNKLLTNLYIDGHFSSLDVTNNTNLISLSINADLTSLDVSKNTILSELQCSYNQINHLDISMNKALTSLSCYRNQISNLNLSNNMVLIEVLCYDNKLTSLNIANDNNTMIANFDASSNPNLSCIQIDSGFAPTTNWEKDNTANYNTSCP